MGKELEVIAQGEFIDQGYRVKTIAIRLLGELQQEELDSHVLNARGCYSSDEEWQKYRAGKSVLQKKIKEKVRQMLKLEDSESFVLENVLSEIYTVVAMYKTNETPKEDR